MSLYFLLFQLWLLCLSTYAFSPSASHALLADRPSRRSAKTDGAREFLTSQGDKQAKQRRVAILVCPAQFCVPQDYDVFFENLRRLGDRENVVPEIGTCRVAPLPRTEWIKVSRQLPTREFLEGRLSVVKTLKWYFHAIETALADIFAEEEDVHLCIIGHSIGGWVARAYLGGLSRSSTSVHRLAVERCTSFITLGTPHVSPDDALIDQTRGLLREIAESSSCKPSELAKQGIDVTCVCSNALGGNFMTTNAEELVAASSYFPLLGRIDGGVSGDGIVPLDLAFMDEPARRVILSRCEKTSSPIRHSHVFPTPWNLIDGYAPSIVLPGSFPSYVSEGVLSQWVQYIR